MNKKNIPKKRNCPGCGFSGDVYSFSPSIEIGAGDFRIFHLYAGMRGPLYCNQCKRKHLLKISDQKNLSEEQKSFLKEKIKEREKKYTNIINKIFLTDK
jgi:hypothetical protein